jgi:putative ABC transport system permease protein
LNYEPLNSVLDISIIYNHNSYIDEEIISDSLKINFNFKIIAVVKELDFLNTPKIYYSYLAFEQLLEETPLEKLSKYKDTFVSWKDVVTNSLDTENISSYSYRIFLKDINKIETLDSFIKTLEPLLIVTFSGLLIRDALLDIVSALDIGMILFLLLTSLGSVLILGILAFSNYMDDRKRNAILMGMGINKNSIIDIHLNESVFIAVISVLISLFLSFFLSYPINILISHLTGYKNMIIIPFSRLFHVPFLFPVLILVLSLMVALFITVIPILFAKKISIKEELKSDD